MAKLLGLEKIALILVFFVSFISAHASELKNKGDYIVVLHGIARSSSHMEELSQYLHKNGFHVLNLDYPSTDDKINELSILLNKKIQKKLTQDKKVHFVGYSMGGLMVRSLIHKYSYKNLGKVIQLAPPNQGSEVADFIQDWWLYKKIYGPAGQQLITDQKDVTKEFGKVDYELGVIAGDFTIDPVSSAIIPGDDDGKVAVKRTKIKGMKDHIVVNASHTFFPSNKEVQKQVLHFLKYSNFKR